MAGATPRVMLAWARDPSGARVQAAALDPRRRNARGPFTCPSCGEPLVARLGTVRARHFAHRPGSRCPLTAPETALHQNVKERLAWLCEEALAGRRRVLLGVRCPACRRGAPVGVAGEADGVVLEGPVGPRRADVLLTRGGRPALALEVRVAHAVDGAKEDDLASLGVPVAEVDAGSAWERAEGDATLIAAGRSSGFPECPSCATLALAEAGRKAGGEAADLAELEGYRARGLLGPPPGRPIRRSRVDRGASPVPTPVPDDRPAPADEPADLELSREDHERLVRTFRCPSCGARSLLAGRRIVRHACPGEPARAVAWVGYDGALVELGWWRRPDRT